MICVQRVLVKCSWLLCGHTDCAPSYTVPICSAIETKNDGRLFVIEEKTLKDVIDIFLAVTSYEIVPPTGSVM
jgi:hypothetical protein